MFQCPQLGNAAVKIALEPGQLSFVADAPDTAEVQRYSILWAGNGRKGRIVPAPGLGMVRVYLPAKAGVTVQAEGDMLPWHRDFPVFVTNIVGFR